MSASRMTFFKGLALHSLLVSFGCGVIFVSEKYHEKNYKNSGKKNDTTKFL